MRKTFHDIIPPEKRSIRNIPIIKKTQTISSTRSEGSVIKRRVASSKAEEPILITKEEVVVEEIETKNDFDNDLDYDNLNDDYEGDNNDRYDSNPPRILLWVVAGASIIGLIFVISMLFSGATVHVTVKSSQYTLNAQPFTAISSDQTSTTTGESESGAVVFQTITLSDTTSVDVASSGEVSTSTKATGRVILYNNYNKSPQTLVSTTRIQTPDGHIYRLANDVVIPGQKIVAGKLTPGSIESDIVADAAGAEYNSDPQDFSIAGFKGTVKYTTFYGRSKGPITGGISGNVQTVSAADLATANDTIQKKLTDSLTQKIISQTPDRFTLYKSTINIQITDLPQKASQIAGKVTISAKGNASAVIFDTTSLIQAIAATSSSDLEDPDLDKLSFMITTADSASPPVGKFDFTLTGTTTVKQSFSNQDLKGELVGLSRTDAQKIFQKYAFDKVDAVIKPFWKKNFPDTVDKIVIEREN